METEGKSEKINDPAELARINPGTRTIHLRKNSQALPEMFFARNVDNFEKYLVDLVRSVLRAKPEMLKTRQQTLSLEEILKYSKIEDLVHDVVERKVNDLSYEGFSVLRSWCEDRGIEIPVRKDEQNAVVELIATRNLIAHNRGIVDERYMRLVAYSKFSVGEKRELDVDILFNALQLLNRVVLNTDAAAMIKFAIPALPMLSHESVDSAAGSS